MGTPRGVVGPGRPGARGAPPGVTGRLPGTVGGAPGPGVVVRGAGGMVGVGIPGRPGCGGEGSRVGSGGGVDPPPPGSGHCPWSQPANSSGSGSAKIRIWVMSFIFVLLARVGRRGFSGPWAYKPRTPRCGIRKDVFPGLIGYPGVTLGAEIALAHVALACNVRAEMPRRCRRTHRSRPWNC